MENVFEVKVLIKSARFLFSYLCRSPFLQTKYGKCVEINVLPYAIPRLIKSLPNSDFFQFLLSLSFYGPFPKWAGSSTRGLVTV